MGDAMSTNNPQQTPGQVSMPQYSASEKPVTGGERFALRVWMLCVFVTLTGTLIFYLIDKIGGAK